MTWNLHKWLFYQILGCKTVKERPNRSTNNEDMAERAKIYVVCEWVSDTLVREKLRFKKVDILLILQYFIDKIGNHMNGIWYGKPKW